MVSIALSALWHTRPERDTGCHIKRNQAGIGRVPYSPDSTRPPSRERRGRGVLQPAQRPAGAARRFLVTQMAAVAELEFGLISERTKAALAVYKAQSGVLGSALPKSVA